MSIYQTVYPSICLCSFLHLFLISLFISSSIYPSLFIPPSVYLFISASISLSVCSFIHLSISVSLYLSVCLAFPPSNLCIQHPSEIQECFACISVTSTVRFKYIQHILSLLRFFSALAITSYFVG